MRAFSPTAITLAGLLLALIEFATAGTELPHLLGETTYAVIAFILGLVAVACTFILRGQITPARPPVAPEQLEPEADDDEPEAGDQE